jgi:hypothetical protein
VAPRVGLKIFHAARHRPGRHIRFASIIRQLAFGLVALGLSLGPGIASAQPGASLEALNRALESLSREDATSGRAADVLGQMLDIATKRRELLAALVEQDPGQVLAFAIPPGVRQRFPAAVQAKLERHVELAGEVAVVYEDYEGRAVLRHFLKANGKRRSLHFAEEPPDLLTGDRVRVRGVEVPLQGVSSAVVAYCCGVDGGLALVGGNGGGKKGGGSGPAPGGSGPGPNTTGEHRVLVMLVNFEDVPLEPYSRAQAQSVVFGTTNDFIKENSYQQTWLIGDVAGWYTIPLASTQCDLFAIASHAKSAASAAGFDLAAYQHYVYAFPRGSCTGLGVGTVGGSPSEAWIIDDLDLKVLSHELGHNLGLHHAHALDCGTAVLGTNCTVFEYGDRIDTMGNVAAGHYNAFHKDLLGWLDSGTAPVVTEVQADGVYTLEPLELAGTGRAALTILKSVDPTTAEKTWYYVEYRRPVGFDGFLSTNLNVLNGVIVHTGSPSNGDSSDQLDMTPGSGLQSWSDWSDPALEVGVTFHDPDAGVTITPLSVSATAAEVSVTFGAASPVPDPSSGLDVTAASDRAVYRWNETSLISATVTANGAAVANASVSFLITNPVGGTTLLNATTGADGTAVVNERFGRRDPRGRYQVHAEATAGSSLRADAWTSFELE